MALHEARILNTSIDVPFEKAYAFAHKPENFPKWAEGLSQTLRKSEEGWVADTPFGKAIVTFSEFNEFGVIDHRVKIEGMPEAYIPMRMVANGSGTEVEVIFYREPGMSHADFERGADVVARDFASLKNILESGA